MKYNIKKLLRKVWSFLFFISGVCFLSNLIQKLKLPTALRVVNYHDLSYHEIKSFLKQIKFLSKRYTFISYEETKLFFEGKINVKNPLLLTFDDGLKGNYDYLFPILKQLNIHALFFVSPGLIGDECHMKEEEIREVIKSGLVKIGCHTYNHVSMNDYLTKEQTYYQVVKSKMKLEEIFGLEIDSFCWTFGGLDCYSQESFNMFIEGKYKYGFCTYSSPVLPSSDKRIIARTNLQNDWNLFEVRYQLSPYHDKKFRKLKKICEQRIANATNSQKQLM